ncbi:MAG: hypothetical protein DWH91_00855 [Planctomycetota bacterium]|nr:MAG: hypothetical protein DWH91_00855 [Planctomycetota bacterium]
MGRGNLRTFDSISSGSSLGVRCPRVTGLCPSEVGRQDFAVIVRILHEAENELLVAAAWYEDQEAGVGQRFLGTYETALGSIRERAESASHLEDVQSGRDIRRVRLRRFPYIVVYELFSEEVVILAVAHIRQRPAYWIGRRGD